MGLQLSIVPFFNCGAGSRMFKIESGLNSSLIDYYITCQKNLYVALQDQTPLVCETPLVCADEIMQNK